MGPATKCNIATLALVLCFIIAGVWIGVLEYQLQGAELRQGTPEDCQDFAVPVAEALKVKCSPNHTIEATEAVIICRCGGR